MIEEYLNSTYLTYHMYNGDLINKVKHKSNDKKNKIINPQHAKNVVKAFFDHNTLFKNKNN